MRIRVDSIQQLHAMGYQPEIPDIKVTNNLTQLLKEGGISITELAKVIGVSRQTIDSFVNHRASPNVEIALKIAHIFQLPVESIFRLSETAWIETAKDENNRTIYFDHLHLELVSGKEMKENDRFERIVDGSGETISSEVFKDKVKVVENEAVKQYLDTDAEDTRRDTLAKIKANVREKLELAYPIRFEVMYQSLMPTVLNGE